VGDAVTNTRVDVNTNGECCPEQTVTLHSTAVNTIASRIYRWSSGGSTHNLAFQPASKQAQYIALASACPRAHETVLKLRLSDKPSCCLDLPTDRCASV